MGLLLYYKEPQDHIKQVAALHGPKLFDPLTWPYLDFVNRNEPLKVHGTLDDVLRAAMSNPKPPKVNRKPKPKAKAANKPRR